MLGRDCSNKHKMTEKRAIVPEQRRQRILDLIRESGGTTLAVLAKEFGISEATARRDLAALEGQGRVKRTHGGAVLPGLSQREDSFQHRLGEAVAAKKRLARAALDLVGEGEAVFVDSSTTAYYAARRMAGTLSRGTFLTNLMPVMELFGSVESPDLSLIGMGGTFRPLTLSFVGPCAMRTIRSYLADRAFLSVVGDHSQGVPHGRQSTGSRGEENDDPPSSRTRAAGGRKEVRASRLERDSARIRGLPGTDRRGESVTREGHRRAWG